MKLGLCTFPTEQGMSLTEMATLGEQAGFESLWLSEHSHIPVARTTPWPGGSELPPHYYRAFDPVPALAAAAAVTSRIRLGFGIALVVQRDPIQFAKSVATLDVLSGARLGLLWPFTGARTTLHAHISRERYATEVEAQRAARAERNRMR